MSVTVEPGDGDVVGAVVELARQLRQAGVAVPPTRVHAMLEALSELGADSMHAVYWSGRLTLCTSPDDIDLFDQVFAAFFSGQRTPPRARVSVVPSYQMVALPADPATAAGDERDDEQPRQLATASRTEVLRYRDVAELTAVERAEVQRFVSLLAPSGPARITRRMRPHPGGAVDPRRTVRAMLRHGGEPVELLRRRRTRRNRRLVFLVDVSGSMAPYADTLLRFAHAACRVRPDTEVFTVGTRLTRVTRELRQREPAAALAALSAAVPDWRGGTRLGTELKAFLDQWGQRGTARGAVVVIASDGWERGDPAPLAEQMARLRRLAARVVWVNPHRGRAGYVPRTGGMLAAMPHVDHLVAGHSLAAMEALARLLGRGGADGVDERDHQHGAARARTRDEGETERDHQRGDGAASRRTRDEGETERDHQRVTGVVRYRTEPDGVGTERGRSGNASKAGTEQGRDGDG